jgi:hypothetical protein
MTYSLSHFFHKFVTTTQTITTTSAAATTGWTASLFVYRSISVNVAGILCEQTQTIAGLLLLNDNSKYAGKDSAPKHDNRMAAMSKTINIHYSILFRNSVLNMVHKLAGTLDA